MKRLLIATLFVVSTTVVVHCQGFSSQENKQGLYDCKETARGGLKYDDEAKVWVGAHLVPAATSRLD